MPRRCIHLIKFLQLFLCSFILLPVIFSSRAYAAADPISVTAQTDVIHFPGSIDFSMKAKDTASPIIQATIYITYKNHHIPSQKNIRLLSSGLRSLSPFIGTMTPAEIIFIHPVPWLSTTGSSRTAPIIITQRRI